MKTTTSVVLTGGLVAAAQWASDKKVTMRMVVGIGILAIGLAAMGEMDAGLAEQFGLLVLVGATFLYGPQVAKGLKLVK